VTQAADLAALATFLIVAGTFTLTVSRRSVR
jgi:hypothetical protein